MLDVLSGGRLVAGFPVGTPMDTTFCYGQSPATLREKYREGVELILRAWSEPDVFSFNGKYTQLRYVNIWPRPMQKPRPPVWVPGGTLTLASLPSIAGTATSPPSAAVTIEIGTRQCRSAPSR